MRWFILRLLGRRLPSLKEKLILPMLAAALIPMTVFMLMVTVTINRSNYASGRAEADKLVLTLAEEFRALETNAGAAAQTLVNSPSVRAIFRELSDGASVSDELACSQPRSAPAGQTGIWPPAITIRTTNCR